MLARLCLSSLQNEVLPWHGHPRGGGYGVPALRLQAPPTHSPQGPHGGEDLGEGGSSTSSALYKSSSNPTTKAKGKKKNLQLKKKKKHQIPMLTKGGREQQPRLTAACGRRPRSRLPPTARKPRRAHSGRGVPGRTAPCPAAPPAGPRWERGWLLFRRPPPALPAAPPTPPRRLLPARPRGCAGETIEGQGGLGAKLRAPGMDGEVCAAPGAPRPAMGM